MSFFLISCRFTLPLLSCVFIPSLPVSVCVCVCVCVELRCSLTCCIIHSLGPVRLIKVLGAERRAPSKYNFPSPLTQYIQHRQSQPRHGFDPPWGLDFPRPPVVTVFEINCLACQILYFQRHRGVLTTPVHLPPSNNV